MGASVSMSSPDSTRHGAADWAWFAGPDPEARARFNSAYEAAWGDQPSRIASHAYDGFHLLMPLYACRRWQGTPQPREGQELAWVRAADLARYPMPPADLPLVPILRDWL